MRYLEVRKKRLRKTLKFVHENPESWKQSSWECGSTACFCGWGRRLSKGFGQVDWKSGKSPNPYEHTYLMSRVSRALVLLTLLVKDLTAFNEYVPRQEIHHYLANQQTYTLFGALYYRLSIREASSLFSTNNSLKQLTHEVELLCEGKSNVTINNKEEV